LHLLFFHSSILTFSWLKPQTFSNLCSSVNCFSDLVSSHTACVVFLFQFMHVSNTWGVALLIRYICVVVFSKYWSKIWIVPKHSLLWILQHNSSDQLYTKSIKNMAWAGFTHSRTLVACVGLSYICITFLLMKRFCVPIIMCPF
jgi:hypothetical protein